MSAQQNQSANANEYDNASCGPQWEIAWQAAAPQDEADDGLPPYYLPCAE